MHDLVYWRLIILYYNTSTWECILNSMINSIYDYRNEDNNFAIKKVVLTGILSKLRSIFSFYFWYHCKFNLCNHDTCLFQKQLLMSGLDRFHRIIMLNICIKYWCTSRRAKNTKNEGDVPVKRQPCLWWSNFVFGENIQLGVKTCTRYD